MCGSVRRWQPKSHVAILLPRSLTLQSSVAVTHHILATAHLTSPASWNPRLRLCAQRSEPGPPAHKSEQIECVPVILSDCVRYGIS